MELTEDEMPKVGGSKRTDVGGARRLVDDQAAPAPTIMAGGIGSVNLSQYTVADAEPGSDKPCPTLTNASPGNDVLVPPQKPDAACTWSIQGRDSVANPDKPAATLMTHGRSNKGTLVEPGIASTSNKSGKPPYRVPTMAETAAAPRTGLVVASTFSGAGGSCTGYRWAGYRVAWASEFVPSAADAYDANKAPDSVLDRRDVRTVHHDDILRSIGIHPGDLDLFDGSPPCFPAEALVLAKRGLTPINEIVVGDAVLTHKGRWRSVLRVGSEVSDTIMLKGQGHWGLETTANHPFWSRKLDKRSTKRNGESCYIKTWHDAEWTDAENMTDLFWATPTEMAGDELSVPAVPGRRVDLSSKFWWMVGRWLGDGWINSCGESLGICCSHDEKEPLKDRLNAIAPLADARRNCQDGELQWGLVNVRTGGQLICSHTGLVKWLVENFGQGAANKTLPAWALTMDVDHRRNLLDGYVSADGFKMRREHTGANTVSKRLAVGVRLLAESLGMTTACSLADVPPTTVIEGRTVNQKKFIRVSWIPGRTRYVRRDPSHTWGRVRQILAGRAGVTVYNIEVEEDNSYTVDGIVVKNCQAFSTAGKRHKGWGEKKDYEGGHSQTNEDLFTVWLRLLRGLAPKTFVAENVSGLVKGTCKGMFIEILKDMKAAGYRVTCRMLDASWLGVPQSRVRAIFQGVREDLGVDPVHPKPLPWQHSVRDALPWIEGARQELYGGTDVREHAGDGPCPTVNAVGGIGASRTNQYSVVQERRVRTSPGQKSATDRGEIGVPVDGPAKTIEAGENGMRIVGPVEVEWIGRHAQGLRRGVDGPSPTLTKTCGEVDLVGEAPTCPESGAALTLDASRRAACDGEQVFGAVNPADANKPCPTVQTSSTSTVSRDARRRFTLLECRRLCGFPDDFRLPESYAKAWACMGNAVPPPMAFWTARTVRDLVLRRGEGPWEGDPACLLAGTTFEVPDNQGA